MLYADVCVNVVTAAFVKRAADEDPLTRTFTYAVPDLLAGRVQPGHLVWVRFGSQRVQGIVMSLSDAAPDFAAREIEALVWAQPLLTPTQLALARWVTDTYLSPLIESLRLMLPAGLTQRGRTVYVRTAVPAPADLPLVQQKLLARSAQTPGEWADISKGLGKITQGEHLDPLLQMNLVRRETEFPGPPPRPKTNRLVTLLVGKEAYQKALASLGRASKRAEALAWLAGQAGPVSVAHLMQAAALPRATVKAMAAQGLITLHPGVAGGDPATVALALSDEAALDTMVTLRGVTKHRAVLDALFARGDPAWIGWVYAETGATLATLHDLQSAGLISLEQELVWRDPLSGYDFQLDRAPQLTEDQEKAWTEVRRLSAEAAPPPILLHGVTGSGKTEIYLRAISAALAAGRQAIVLVPEIALTPQTIRRFAARFPGKVTVWHSELSDGERFDVWRRVHTNHPAAQVMVGSRSALFLPCPALGVIIVDEEHEPSYKQERTPRYHARTAALALGRLAGAPVILGSATPALETYFAARNGEMALLTLPRRVVGHADALTAPAADAASARLFADLPDVRVVDMRQELRAGNRSMFSRALSTGLRHILVQGQQAILYLNRRGSATFVLCRDCGHVEICPRCTVPLTLHHQGEQLVCHHCNRRYPVPARCPKCSGTRIRHLGVGTERVEEAVHLEFPDARTLRWDRDVTGARGSHDAILSRFVAHEADILVGTQMIAKGLDLPLVTLVGVIAADTTLFLPDFRAVERTFQLLTQVAGRAGRSALGGEVIVQTYQPDHYAILAAADHDYESFYRQEMGFRREQAYPPIRRLARLVYHHTDRGRAQAEALRMGKALRDEIARLALPDTDLIGPAPCYFARQRDDYRWHVAVRSPDPTPLVRAMLPAPDWRVDIDPVDML